MTRIIFAGNYEETGALLKEGRVGILPSDTIYSLSAVREKEDRLYEIKKRSGEKKFITLYTAEQLKESDIKVPAFLFRHWPSALTAVLDYNGGTLAIRVPSDPFINKVLEISGPILSTSVNISGETPLFSFEEIYKAFDGIVDFIVKDESVGKSSPSTIIRVEGESVRIIRQGSYNFLASM